MARGQAGHRTRWLLYGIVGSGIAVRVAVFLYKRSFWLDESMLAANLLRRSYTELLGRLDYVQVAPPLFLFICKALYGIWGQLEYSLRLFPLVCGCLTLLMLGKILSREAPKFFSLCAVALYAFDFSHIDWATTFKQYASDELCAVLILIAAVGWERFSARTRYALAALLPALVWLSYTSAFMIVGFACMAAVSAFKSRERSRRTALIVLLMSSVIFSSALYFIAVQHSIAHEVQVRNFAAGFPHRPHIGWFFGSLASLFGSSASFQYGPALAFIIVVWGAVAVARSRNFGVSLLAAGTLFAAFCASCLRVYPLSGGRLGTYWAGISLFLLAHGLSALHDSFRSQIPARFVNLLAVFLVLAAIYGTVSDGSWLIAREEMRMVARDLRAKPDDDVPIFVSAQARSSFRVYGGSLLERRVVWLVEWDIMPKELYNKWIDAGCPDRFWFVMSHYDFSVVDKLLLELGPYLAVKERIRHWDSAAYLVEITPKETWPSRPLEDNESD